jgi:chaperonin cofactor prefoldin
MKITKQQLKKQFSNTELEKFVLRDILEVLNKDFERLKQRFNSKFSHLANTA